VKLIKRKCYSGGQIKKKENAFTHIRRAVVCIERGKSWVLCRSIKIYLALLPAENLCFQQQKEQQLMFYFRSVQTLLYFEPTDALFKPWAILSQDEKACLRN